MTGLVIILVLLISMALFSLHIYGIYHSFKAHIAWGITSILLSPLAFVVGAVKLTTGKNLLKKSA